MCHTQIHLDKIDNFLRKLETAKDDDELRQFFLQFDCPYDRDVPSDPFSAEYRQKQLNLYEKLAGRPYSSYNEKTNFDIDQCAFRPFPYCHGSSKTVGNQLMAIGFAIKTMNLSKGASILEFGPGWGNITLILAKMGFQVTAVDIERNFIDLIRQRSLMENLEVQLVHGDFSYIHTAEKKYDAVLFFESFHHAQDHLDIMKGFDRVLKKDGIVCFASESVTDEFPIPWGLKMDGESLWAIRKNGWLELGFNKKYFIAALDRFGWCSFVYQGYDGPWSHVIIARRKKEAGKVYRFVQNELRSLVGTIENGLLETSGDDEGYAVFGPYDILPIGNWKAEILLDACFHSTGEIVIDVVDENATVKVAVGKTCKLKGKAAKPCNIYFSNDKQLSRFEIRVWCRKGTRVRIEGIKLEPT